MSPAPVILIVEDDQSLRESLAMILEHQKYTVITADSGETALPLAQKHQPHVVILDLNLPGIDGLEVCTRLRQRNYDGAVLMLTARHGIEDRVKGLQGGADDYLPKPFALQELLARVDVMLRRVTAAAPPVADGPVITVGAWSVHRTARVVLCQGTEVDLTKTEFDLMEYLFTNIGVVLSREKIMDRVWGYEAELASNSLQVFISTLRQKIKVPGQPSIIETVRGVGYVVRGEP